MTRLIKTLRQNQLTLTKTASYYVIHITVAACVAYAVTGNLIASLTLSLLEVPEANLLDVKQADSYKEAFGLSDFA